MCKSIHCPLHGQTCGDCLNRAEEDVNEESTVKETIRGKVNYA